MDSIMIGIADCAREKDVETHFMRFHAVFSALGLA